MSVKNFKLDLKKYRKIKGWTQLQLATKVGISQSYLSSLENNNYTKSPSLALLENICDVLHVCLFDVIKIDCSNNCENCKHKISISEDTHEEIHYYL